MLNAKLRLSVGLEVAPYYRECKATIVSIIGLDRCIPWCRRHFPSGITHDPLPFAR